MIYYNATRLLILLISFQLLSCTTQQLLDAKKVKWEAVSTIDGSVPVERHEAAFIGYKDRFYLLGGRRMNPTSIYDPLTKTWANGNPPPLEIHHFQPVGYNDKIYVLGALTGKYPGETPIPNIYLYDPMTDSWEKGPKIPADRNRGATGAVVYNGKIYLACGIKDGHRGDHKKWFDVYDPATNQWSILPDAPRARDHFQAIVVQDKLYLIGGRTTVAANSPFKGTIGEVDVFDFKTNTWSTLPDPLPTLRAGNYLVGVGNEICVFGGESFTQNPAHNEVEVLNTQNNTWRSLPPMLQGRHGTGAIRYQDKIYIASGSANRGGGPELQTIECMSLK